MNRDNIKELFKLIVHIYPTFEVSTEKINTWTRLMKHQNYKRVMQRAERYVLENKFPPTIADLSERNIAARRDENMFIGSLLKDGTLIKESSIQPKHLYDPFNKKY